MDKIDDEERINEILTDRHNLLNGINDLMGESVESSESLLSIEEEINGELVEEKNNRQDIIDKIVEIIDYESIRKDSLTSINESLKEEKQHRYDISDAIDVTSSSEEKRIETLDYVNENLKYQISHLNSLNSTLSSTTASYQNIATAANNAVQQSGNIQPPQQPNNNQTQSGNTNNTKPKIDNENISAVRKTLVVIYEKLKQIGVEGFNKWVEIDDKIHKVGRTIGLNGEQARAMVDDITGSYANMAQRLGMTFSEIFKFQEEYNKNIGRAIILTNDQVETMAGLSKLVGDVAVNDMVKNMDDFGASSELATDYLTQNMARAKSQGLDAKKTSEAFANNVKLASKYNFREGVNGISKMTLLSQKLKFNMDSIANAAEKFETVEGAIGTAANLQMLGGSFAAQFGNPLEAMNMAMLDMEGFTNKIVDTFSGKAIFNRETGQAEMSAIDKRLLKEAAKQLGLSYEDAWNMATQSAKIKDVERSLKPSENFTEEQKALIANKSIFKDGKHQVTYYDSNNDQVTKSVDQLTADDLQFLTDEKTTEIAMANDVHQIRDILRNYLGDTVKGTKSAKETWEGNKEQIKITNSNVVDFVIGERGRNFLDDIEGYGQTILSTVMFSVGSYLNLKILDFLNGTKATNGGMPSSHNTNRNSTPNPSGSPKPNQSSGTPNPSGSPKPNQSSGTPKAKGSVLRRGLRRAPGRALLKTIGKQGLKRLPGIGTALAIFDGVVEGANAISTYSQKKMEIENSNLSEKEKAIAKTEAKRERNKGVGGAAGGAIGTFAGAAKGAALGAALGPVGMLIGSAIGGAVGYFGGKAIGSAVGGAVTSEEKTEEEKKQEEIKNNEVSDKNTILTQIRDYNHLIYELLLNRYSMVSQSNINNNSSFNQNVIENASKQLGINNNNYAYQNFDYKKLSNGYVANNIDIKGNPIRKYNEKEYDLRDPKQRRDYSIDKILDREINGSRQRQVRDSKLNLENRTAKILYGVEPYDYKNDKRYNGNDKTPKVKNKIYKYDYGDFDVNQNTNYQNSLVSKPNTYHSLVNSLYDNISVRDMYYNNTNVLSKPIVGEPTWIKNTVDFKSPNYINDSTPISNKLDLNVSGTIKLTSDKGQNINLDIDKLLNNSEFVRKLTEVITNRLNKNSNGGRTEKNSVESINNASSVKTRNQ